MTRPQSSKTMYDRRALANQGMVASIATRSKAKCDQKNPICIYSMCDALGVQVRFNNINMEGMYQKGMPPRIHLSARRPLPRRVYNCAHELGHHVFGHGSSIDELREDAKASIKDPKEFLVDAFAGFLLMPTLGMRRAFAVRGWNPQTAAPLQLFTIACEFGVGYRSLVTHLSVSLSSISKGRADVLKRVQPKDIRTDVFGRETEDPLIIADSQWSASTVDSEVGTWVLLPKDARIEGDAFKYERDLQHGNLFRSTRPGIARAETPDGSFAVFLRVARKEYVGLAQYRHLEDDSDEQIEEVSRSRAIHRQRH
jgi:Zn-dependent peptidase ImmA (M78 family)